SAEKPRESYSVEKNLFGKNWYCIYHTERLPLYQADHPDAYSTVKKPDYWFSRFLSNGSYLEIYSVKKDKHTFGSVFANFKGLSQSSNKNTKGKILEDGLITELSRSGNQLMEMTSSDTMIIQSGHGSEKLRSKDLQNVKTVAEFRKTAKDKGINFEIDYKNCYSDNYFRNHLSTYVSDKGCNNDAAKEAIANNFLNQITRCKSKNESDRKDCPTKTDPFSLRDENSNTLLEQFNKDIKACKAGTYTPAARSKTTTPINKPTTK
ncbi:MAG: hypothetical protein ACOYOK_06925, partial [Pseudobdellovibrionaceae bacterium]